MSTESTPSKAKTKKPDGPNARLSRTRKPAELSLEQWQAALRRQYGAEQDFRLENAGEQPIFSDFRVTNPQTRSAYRVSIRGAGVGDNFCSCPDFLTNTLGTCKHIEFTLAKLRKKRGGAKALAAGFSPAYSEIYLQYGAERSVRFRPGSDCPEALRGASGGYFDECGILKPEAFGRFEDFLRAAPHHQHEVRCHEDVLAFIAEIRDRDRRREIVDKAFPGGVRSAAFKDLVRAELYDYQRHGALFAARAGRCLIGDDMGLGKTIQAIAAAEIMARNLGVERVLIVCPTSLKHQWEREIGRFTPRRAMVIGGMRARREEAFRSDSFFKITNYDTIHADLDLIERWSPDLVILDEAQRIKNWNTRTARSVKKIASPYAIVLTGTPLENRLEELMSIVQFVDRYRLGPTFRFLADHQVMDAEGKVVGYRGLDHIGQTLEPILVRRKKEQVLKQLPPRLDKNFFVPMTPQQKVHHDENRDIVAKIVHKWRRMGFLTEADQRRLMIALQYMRMSCDSTYLLDQQTDHGVKADELATLLEEIFEQPESKVVIFSQWLRMHEVLQRRIQGRKWSYALFHGGVESSKRGDLVDRFREDPACRAFLSTDAGGVGLNLQHASAVINVDMPWNPAVLEQRIGRVHRMGQRQPVRVVNFIAQGTIEEGMLGVIKFKKSLSAGILDSGEAEVFMGGSRLKRFMETVEKATGAIPEASVEEPTDGEARAVEVDAAGVPGEKASGEMAAAEPSPVDRGPAHPSRAMQTPTPAAAADPWSGLLQTGLSILEQLASAARGGGAAAGTATVGGIAPVPGGVSLVHRDERTGESYVRLPMPSGEVLDRALSAISAVLERFRK